MKKDKIAKGAYLTAFVLILLVVAFVVNGCSSVARSSRTETSTVVSADNSAQAMDNTSSAQTPSEKTVTKTETKTETRDSGGGIIGTTVNLIGEVLSFPFRIIGGLIRAVF